MVLSSSVTFASFSSKLSSKLKLLNKLSSSSSQNLLKTSQIIPCSHSKNKVSQTQNFFQKSHFSTSLARNIKMPSLALRALPQEIEESIDPVQRALLAEQCILLNDADEVVGWESKKNCHLVQSDGSILLHRAFSVFLFNEKGELLLQQRSPSKITFPSMYTNTCCSHPLFRPDEMVENEALGVKVAAQRRLFEELGISGEQVPLEKLHYLTRIHYKAASDSIWGEHEIDYIFFIQTQNLLLSPNVNEVEDVKWVSMRELKEMRNDESIKMTPWFKLILDSGKLGLWWKNLDNLKEFEDHTTIHKL